MHTLKRAALLALVLAVSLIPGIADGSLTFPKPQGYVSDYADLLSPQARDSVEGRLRDFEKSTGSEIAVVVVDNLQGTSIEDFAVRLFEDWKIGKKGEDNGVLFLVAKRERQIRIEVGYGLEPQLTDAKASSIIRNTVSPAFKAGDFDAGVQRGVEQIIEVLSGKPVPESPASDRRSARLPSNLPLAVFGILFFLGIGILQWLAAVFARTKSWWAGGVAGFLVGVIALLVGGLAFGLFAIFTLTVLGLAFDYKVSKSYKEHKGRDEPPPWWAGGGWGPGGGYFGGSGSDSGGFGGFGGFGGGESGGGGASGDW